MLEADDDVALAAVTVAELRTGVELASGTRRKGREDLFEWVLATIPVEQYDVAVAHIHGRLLAIVHREGKQPSAHRLIIAATAVATRRSILTVDRSAQFGDLPGVDCIELS